MYLQAIYLHLFVFNMYSKNPTIKEYNLINKTITPLILNSEK
jgi:hypothetical protein